LGANPIWNELPEFNEYGQIGGTKNEQELEFIENRRIGNKKKEQELGEIVKIRNCNIIRQDEEKVGEGGIFVDGELSNSYSFRLCPGLGRSPKSRIVQQSGKSAPSSRPIDAII
jgi:hypothetical protein